MANPFQTLHGAVEWVLEKVKALEKDHGDMVAQNEILEEKVKGLGDDKLVAQNKILQEKVKDFERDRVDSHAQTEALQKKVDDLERTKNFLEHKVSALEEKSEQLQNRIDDLNGRAVEPTHRNILYNEEKHKKRLPVLQAPVRWAREVGSLVFGETFAVSGQQTDGQDVWLRIHGGVYTDKWVLSCDGGTVNCVEMTKYDHEKHRTRIRSADHHGQNFPKKLYTEGFAGSSQNNVCLISASGDSLWREINIEMLLRGIATATVFEMDWGGDHTFTDWVAYYAVNCVQYGQLRTPQQKQLKVTVKPTSRWRDYRAGRCLGPDLGNMRDDLGAAQYKECCWLKGMKDQLHVKWEEVEFVTAFAFLRAQCAWTRDDCREAANDRFVWVLQEFLEGGHNDNALYELERAHWLWDEAFDGCTYDEAARTMAYSELQRVAKLGVPLAIPHGLHTAGAEPLAWALIVSTAPRISAGERHNLALTASGVLRAWGSNTKKQCSVPRLAPGETWAAVSAGGNHSLGLTVAGTLHAWGGDSHGQLSAPTLAEDEHWVAVSAGYFHSLGLTATGKLHAWGYNRYRQCTIPELPPGDRWAAVSAGYVHSLGLIAGGTLYAWGNDTSGQCSRAPVLPSGERWAAISGGHDHSLGLTVGGKLHAWGADQHHQCSGIPTLAAGEHWTAISAGEYHSLGLTSTGALHVWGKGEHGQRNVPTGERWLAASAGRDHNLGLTSSGAVRAWGEDSEGQVSRAP